MRWILVIILAYAVLLLQTTLVKAITFNTASIGAIGPDLMAALAVFLVLHARSISDAMISAWVMGLGLDLTISGGTGTTTVVGPMPIGYALAGAVVYQIRDVFFSEWIFTQALLTLAFCLMAHGLWVLWQSLAALPTVSWGIFGDLLVQALLLSAYSAALAPVLHLLLRPLRRVLVPATPNRMPRVR